MVRAHDLWFFATGCGPIEPYLNSMAKKKKNNVYLVEIKPGEFKTFRSWPECQRVVNGTPLLFAGGVDEAEAKGKIARVKKARQGKPQRVFHANKGSRKGSFSNQASSVGEKPTSGICSDAGTHGNPGPCECQVCDLQGNRLAYKRLGVHTNNYAEMAGILLMIQCAIEQNETLLWTDSQIAMGWIKKGQLGPTVREPELILDMVRDIQALLAEHPQLSLRKWHTKAWGEIPADFGRK